MSRAVVKTQRIGFIIDGHRPSVSACLKRKCPPRGLLMGCPSGSANGFMRFGWIAQEVNGANDARYCYELFRPWRSYAAVFFLKSMGSDCLELAGHIKRRGTRIVFDLNVDYFSWPQGRFFFDGMAPYAWQRRAAFKMARIADAISCASEHIAWSASRYHRQVHWISDNIRPEFIRHREPHRQPFRDDGRLQLLWSGQAHKLFDLLSIGDVLRENAPRIHLKIITGSLSGLDMLYPHYRRKLISLLAGLDHEVLPFRDIGALHKIYQQGGIFLSPRFLDNTYNPGHSEWKITLAMAAGNMVLCSEQPSYRTVYHRAGGIGIHLCRSNADWRQAFEDIFSDRIHWRSEQEAAVKVVAEHYATPVVADLYTRMLDRILET